MIRPDVARFAEAFEAVARENMFAEVDTDLNGDEVTELHLRGVVVWEGAPAEMSCERELDSAAIGERLIEALRREGFVVSLEER